MAGQQREQPCGSSFANAHSEQAWAAPGGMVPGQQGHHPDITSCAPPPRPLTVSMRRAPTISASRSQEAWYQESRGTTQTPPTHSGSVCTPSRRQRSRMSSSLPVWGPQEAGAAACLPGGAASKPGGQVTEAGQGCSAALRAPPHMCACQPGREYGSLCRIPPPPPLPGP